MTAPTTSPVPGGHEFRADPARILVRAEEPTAA